MPLLTSRKRFSPTLSVIGRTVAVLRFTSARPSWRWPRNADFLCVKAAGYMRGIVRRREYQHMLAFDGNINSCVRQSLLNTFFPALRDAAELSYHVSSAADDI